MADVQVIVIPRVDVYVHGKRFSGVPEVCNTTRIGGTVHLFLPDLCDTIVECKSIAYPTIFGILTYDDPYLFSFPSSLILMCLRPGDSHDTGGTLLNMSIDFARKTLSMSVTDFMSIFVHGLLPGQPGVWCDDLPDTWVPGGEYLNSDPLLDPDCVVPQLDLFDIDYTLPGGMLNFEDTTCITHLCDGHLQPQVETQPITMTNAIPTNENTEITNPEIHGMDSEKEYEIRLHGSLYRTRDFIPFMKKEIIHPEDVEREIDSYLGDCDQYLVVEENRTPSVSFTVSKMGLLVYVSERCM
jgi:hypothetical protein